MQKQCPDQICIYCWLISCIERHDMLSAIDDMLVNFIYQNWGYGGSGVVAVSHFYYPQGVAIHATMLMLKTFTMWMFAMFKETLTSMCEVWYLGGRWKFDEVALKAVGILKMCTDFLVVMNVVTFPVHIRVMVLDGVESGDSKNPNIWWYLCW